MLFHLGALWRLNDLSYLPRLDRVSSVSGGSIVAAMLGLAWRRLMFDADGRATNFEDQVAEPIRLLATQTIDRRAIMLGLALPGSVGNRIAGSYRRYLFGRASLQDLPDLPNFNFNATNLQSGGLWRFSKSYMIDYRVGRVRNPNVELALAVAASSAFPPFLSPVILRFDQTNFEPDPESDLNHPPFTTRVLLTDGGVYDNLGIEDVWPRYQTILISDGSGGSARPMARPPRNWPLQTQRVFSVINPQLPFLRSRQAITAFASRARLGAYWGIRSNIDDYGLSDSLPCFIERTGELGEIRTRLQGVSDETQKALINWGYAVCDAAMRKHVEVGATTPARFPYPEVPLV